MPRTLFKAKVFTDGELIAEKTFDRKVIRVGSLSSSHIVLDQIARMHAVIEKADSGYCLLDLGSSVGCMLNNERVERTAMLPETGKIDLGPWSVVYEIVEDPKSTSEILREIQERAREREKDPERWEREARLNERAGSRASDEDRLNVVELRNIKPKSEPPSSVSNKEEEEDDDEDKKWERRRVAMFLNMGPDFVKKVYELSPEQATEKAVETGMQVASATQTLQWLDKSGLKKDFSSLAKSDSGQMQFEAFKKGLDNVEEHLKHIIIGGLSSFTLLASRSGGYELTEEDQKQLEEEWLKAVEQANSAKEE